MVHLVHFQITLVSSGHLLFPLYFDSKHRGARGAAASCILLLPMVFHKVALEAVIFFCSKQFFYEDIAFFFKLKQANAAADTLQNNVVKVTGQSQLL